MGSYTNAFTWLKNIDHGLATDSISDKWKLWRFCGKYECLKHVECKEGQWRNVFCCFFCTFFSVNMGHCWDQARQEVSI